MRTKKYDEAEFLTDDETISAYLTEALESDDPRYIAKRWARWGGRGVGLLSLPAIRGLRGRPFTEH